MFFKRQVFLFLFLLSSTAAFSQVVINEVCAINGNGIVDEDGDNSDWIELYNKGTNAINILNYSISDRSNERKFTFPSITILPDSFLLIFVSDKDRLLPIVHTNFKISEGETIYLFSESGKIADSFVLNETQLDHSIGRFPDGSSIKYIYTNPSPGNVNAVSQFQFYTVAPQFSLQQNF